MATYSAPVVPAFPAGYAPLQSDFATWWYQNASFLQNRIVARVSQTTTATTLPASGADTVIDFDTVLEDPYSGWVGSPFWEWRPPAGYSGWFEVTVCVRTAAVPAGADLQVNVYNPALSTVVPAQCAQAGDNFGAGVCGSWTTYLVGGQDSVAAAASLLNSGSAVNTSLTAGQQSTMQVVWLSQL